MKENEINKSNRIKIFVLVMLTLLVSVAGISYAYFTINIVGNDTASSMRLRTANMQLVYNDVQIVSGEYATPGWTQTKTLTVTNTGNVTATYNFVWRDLINEVTNRELVISATCSATSGTCPAISEIAVPTYTTEVHNIGVTLGISIAPGVTHTYTVTATFKETGSNQNYNQNKYFNGTLNIEEYSLKRNGTDSVIGLPLVRVGTEEFYIINEYIDYENLISHNGGNGNVYNYASDKTIMLARYNLYVGIVYGGGITPIVISQSDVEYGLQNEKAKGYVDSGVHYATVPFSGTNYWWDTANDSLKSQYGAGDNVYDPTYDTAPNYSAASNYNSSFNNNSSNMNYSVAYYVEEYVERLGLDAIGRLPTHEEIDYLGQKARTGGEYWTSSSSLMPERLWYTNSIGTISSDKPFYYSGDSGVRPVIVVNTSDIQSS